MISDSLKIVGDLEVVLLDSNKEIKDRRDVKNLVMAAGKDYISERMTSNTTSIMSHMAVGSANVAAVASQTELGTELGRVALDSSNVASNTITYIATFGAGVATGTVAEAGIFNDASANTGTMLCRTRFNEVNKAADDSIVITWNVTVQ